MKDKTKKFIIDELHANYQMRLMLGFKPEYKEFDTEKHKDKLNKIIEELEQINEPKLSSIQKIKTMNKGTIFGVLVILLWVFLIIYLLYR